MSVDIIACILLLSTILWDLSSGRKGGLQSHREPLSILELTAAVFYLHLFEDTHIDYTSFLFYIINWFNRIIIYNELIWIIQQKLNFYMNLLWYNQMVKELLYTQNETKPLPNNHIIKIKYKLMVILILKVHQMVMVIYNYNQIVKEKIYIHSEIKLLSHDHIILLNYSLKKRFKYIQIKRLKNKSIITSMMIWCSDPRQQQLEASYHHKIKKRFKYIQIKRLKNKSKNYYKIITSMMIWCSDPSQKKLEAPYQMVMVKTDVKFLKNKKKIKIKNIL
eukprot:170036_1